MIPSDLVDLSRLQFALTAMYHFIFVPLTLGLSFMLVVMELAYVISGKQMYKDMTRFWGKLFGINFAIGVATGLTMEFQFGTNWAYYSHYVGDIFGAPLAIEGLMAFFLESTFIGLFFFGWDRLSRGKHLLVTFLMALGSNLSALWILVANGWMMNPIGAEFNFETMRMEMTNFWAVFTSEWLHDRLLLRDGDFRLLHAQASRCEVRRFLFPSCGSIRSRRGSAYAPYGRRIGLPRHARSAHQDRCHGSYLGHA